METYEMLMTPTQAKALLGVNTANRHLRRSRVAYFVGLIQRGEWKLTHQGIAIGRSGRLLDGQHRLEAVVETDTPVPMMVSFDVDDSAFEAMDRTLPRSVGDVLHLPASTVALAIGLQRIADGTFHIRQSLAPEQVKAAYSRWQNVIDPVMEASMRKQERSNTSTRAACCARILRGDGDYALAAYRAFARLDFDHMPRICQALVRQIDNGNIGKRDGGVELLVRAWIAFDPKRADLNTIAYKDADVSMDEIQDALNNPRRHIRRVA